MFTEWFIRHSNLDEYKGHKREVAKFCVRIFAIALVLASVFGAYLMTRSTVIVEFVSKVNGG